jgi:hypothetical protein
MEDLDNEISSIVLGTNSIIDPDARLSLLSDEISSISEISVSEVIESFQVTQNSQADVKVLRDKLMENLNVLQGELKLLEESNRREATQPRDSVQSEEIIEQLTDIKSKVDFMKLKLRKSEEMIVQRTQENEELKHQLHDLELKNFTSKDSCVSCVQCTQF